MEALGSPSISRASMGGAMLSENRKLVNAGNRYNDIHYRSLPEIHFTALGFFFVRFCLCFFLVFFFCESTHYEKQ